MNTKEVYQYGTKPENPVREIGLLEANAKPRPPWNSELQFYKDEVTTLEKDINDLECELHNKEEEIESLEEKVAELQAEIRELRLHCN